LRSPNLATVDMTDAEIRTRWQQGAAGLAQVKVIDEAERDFLLSLGVTLPAYTKEDIAAARATLARQALASWFAARVAAVQEAIESGQATDKDAVRALITD